MILLLKCFKIAILQICSIVLPFLLVMLVFIWCTKAEEREEQKRFKIQKEIREKEFLEKKRWLEEQNEPKKTYLLRKKFLRKAHKLVEEYNFKLKIEEDTKKIYLYCAPPKIIKLWDKYGCARGGKYDNFKFKYSFPVFVFQNVIPWRESSHFYYFGVPCDQVQTIEIKGVGEINGILLRWLNLTNKK